MRCLKSILCIRWWHQVTHVETCHSCWHWHGRTRATAEATPLDWACNSHAFQSSSPTLTLWGITQWAADAWWPKITLQGPHSSYSEEVQHSYLRFGKARNREIHGEVLAPVVWAHSVRCQIKQLQVDAPASTTGATQQQLVPDVRNAAECVPPSLACAATFVATSHVLHNAPIAAQTSSRHYATVSCFCKLGHCYSSLLPLCSCHDSLFHLLLVFFYFWQIILYWRRDGVTCRCVLRCAGGGGGAQRPARINMWTTMMLDFEGANALLFCRTEGNPHATVTWFDPEDRRIISSSTNRDDQYLVCVTVRSYWVAEFSYSQ